MANYDITIEGSLPVVQIAGFNTNKAAAFGSTIAVTGAATFASTVAITGNATVAGSLTVTGAITGPRVGNIVVTAAVGTTVVLTAALSGTTYIMSATSGTPSFTLPAVAAGLEFTFITANTTAGYTVTTGTTSLIRAKTTATGTAITSTATTGTLVNTQATAVVGDSIKLICDGTDWRMVSQTGIFAVT